jgi:hypothetical protein
VDCPRPWGEKGVVFDRLNITVDTQILKQIVDILSSLTEKAAFDRGPNAARRLTKSSSVFHLFVESIALRQSKADNRR